MGTDNRQTAYENLLKLADEQGYVTFDDIMSCADEYSLPIQDFDWLSNSITTRGILVYSEAPSHTQATDDVERDDFAQSDYDAVYARIIELSPSLESFVTYVKNIKPPQRGEIKQLKYQIVDGNAYARNRMIEMHLRIALRVALQRSEAYDMEIEDAVGYACIGLVIAVDKYDPDTSGAFASYATLWILQNISREQSTQRPLIYFPAHQKESYFTMYPILKERGCIGCERLWRCEEAREIIQNRLNCNEEDTLWVISQMIPDERIEVLLELCNDELDEICPRGVQIRALLRGLSSETVISDEDAYTAAENTILQNIVAETLHTLKPREEEVIRLRYGFDGQERTLEEVGALFNVTRERIRQIEAKALRKLRNPARSKNLKKYY